MDLEAFTEKWPMREPNEVVGSENVPSFYEPLAEDEGLMTMPCANEMTPTDREPSDEKGNPDGLYLWLIREEDVAVMAEEAPERVKKKVKHTNLAASGRGRCGGEVWRVVAEEETLYVSGFSGRFGPRTPEELEDAVSVFAEYHQPVVSMGWAPDLNSAAKYFRAG